MISYQKQIMANNSIYAGAPVYKLNADGVMVSLICRGDADKTEFLLTPGEFPELFDAENSGFGSIVIPERSDGVISHTAFSDDGDKLRLHIEIKNTAATPARISSVMLPLLMDQAFRGGERYIYEKNVIRNSALLGNSAYVTWSRLCGQSPVLVLLACGDTAVRHFALKTPRLANHGAVTFEGIYSLILSETPVTLSYGESLYYDFVLFFVADKRSVPAAIAANGGISCRAIPGMTVPVNEPVTVKLYYGDGGNTDVGINDIEIIPPDGADIKTLDRCHISAVFTRFGENVIRLRKRGETGTTDFAFFVIEPLSDIYGKHADFIIKNQLETDPDDPCYHALLAWDILARRRINSKHNPYDDWMRGGSDEIGLAPAVFLAEKNRYAPVPEEIDTLITYTRDFVEQRLTEQPGWRVHRMVPWYVMFEPWAGYGADDVWRAYNYVHVVNIYFALYRIASHYDYDKLETPAVYLEKSARYAIAMFSYWMFPDSKGASHYCNMGETVLPIYIIPALRREGLDTLAGELEAHIEKKKITLTERKYPFGSEMVYDTTAFEAAYGYAVGSDNGDFAARTIAADLCSRGSQPVWHKYMVDIRQQGDSGWNVSYMTQLGAWPFMDMLFRGTSRDPELALAAYGAYTAGFSIYNSGGVWDPSPENDGTCLWVLEDYKLQYKRHDGMLMSFSGEGSFGFFGALRAAASYRIQNSDFGQTGLGCKIETSEGGVKVRPDDGINIRFIDLIYGGAVALEGAGIVFITESSDGWCVRLSPYASARTVTVYYNGFENVIYNGKAQKTYRDGGRGISFAEIKPDGGAEHDMISIYLK